MSETKPTVQLRAYKTLGLGNKVVKDEDGKIQNENQEIALIYGNLEWNNYLKYLGVHGFIRVDVEKVTPEDDKLKEKISKEVSEALNPKEVVELTPEQKKIAELEAKIEALIGGGQTKKNDKPKDEGLKALQAEYEEVVGKKPFHGWDEATLKEKMEEAQNS